MRALAIVLATVSRHVRERESVSLSLSLLRVLRVTVSVRVCVRVLVHLFFCFLSFSPLIIKAYFMLQSVECAGNRQSVLSLSPSLFRSASLSFALSLSLFSSFFSLFTPLRRVQRSTGGVRENRGKNGALVSFALDRRGRSRNRKPRSLDIVPRPKRCRGLFLGPRRSNCSTRVVEFFAACFVNGLEGARCVSAERDFVAFGWWWSSLNRDVRKSRSLRNR